MSQFDSPVIRRILLLIFNPTLTSKGNAALTTYMNWNDPDSLTAGLLTTFPQVSNGYINYVIQERQVINGYFVKMSGFSFTNDSYLACLQNTSTCNSELIDYRKLITDFGICQKPIDEVWLWGGPWFGYLEYTPRTDCGRTIFIMGFNYERGPGEAIHNFGHRMEYIGINRVGRKPWAQDETNEWNKFSLINGHCGNVHYPPGTIPPAEEYKYDKNATVTTDCTGYHQYPNGPFIPQSITCSAWGCTQQGYITWWLSQIPHSTGTFITPGKQKIYNNWWKYWAYYDETFLQL